MLQQIATCHKTNELHVLFHVLACMIGYMKKVKYKCLTLSGSIHNQMETTLITVQWTDTKNIFATRAGTRKDIKIYF